MKKKKRLLAIISCLALFFAIIDQHRYFIYDVEKKQTITIWKRLGFGDCYIIPGKYYSIFAPTTNYIRTKNSNNYLGIIFNTFDESDLKVSLYQPFDSIGLSKKVKAYANNEKLLTPYGFLELGDSTTSNLGSVSRRDSLRKLHDYRYYKLNGLWRIQLLIPE